MGNKQFMNYSVGYSNSDDDILLRTFKGPGTIHDIISSWEYVINNELISKNHIGVISDYREAIVQGGVEDLKLLGDYFRENMNIFKDLRMAQVLTTPDIALPIYFTELFPEFHFQPFSTIEEARYWIIYKQIRNTD